MSQVFRIDHKLIDLKIDLVEVKKLLSHEEVIPHNVIQFKKEIIDTGYIFHPIIVEKQNLVILDGMHRAAVIKEIGYKYIPVCLVDYRNPHIVISSWCRLIKGLDINEILQIITELNLTIESCSFEKAYGLIEKRKAIAAILSQSKCYGITGQIQEIKEIYETIKHFESKLRSKHYTIEYVTERYARKKVNSSKIFKAIMTPKVSKNEVIETALTHALFPPKTSCHMIPARPLFINAPIELLRGNLSRLEACNRLFDLLNSKKLVYIPSEQVLSHQNKEDLFLFK